MKLPRQIGKFEEKEITVSVGKFGPYILHDSKFYSLKKDNDPLTLEHEKAIELINEKRQKDLANILKVFEANPGLKILNGRYGPYISYNKKNYKLPRSLKIDKITIEDCLKIIEQNDQNPKKTFNKKKK